MYITLQLIVTSTKEDNFYLTCLCVAHRNVALFLCAADVMCLCKYVCMFAASHNDYQQHMFVRSSVSVGIRPRCYFLSTHPTGKLLRKCI